MMTLGEFTPYVVFFAVVSGCLGCVIGSFLNVVVWRVPLGMSLVSPPSHCPNCGHQIRAYENIPIISWLFLRGKCSGCHQPISIKYPLGELCTGLCYVAVFLSAWRQDLPVAVLAGRFFLLGVLISLAQIDIRHGILPDAVTYFGMTGALVLSLMLPYGRVALSTGGLSFAKGGYIIQKVVECFGAWGMDLPSSPLLFAGIDCIVGLLTGLVLLGVVAIPGAVASRWQTADALTWMGLGDMKFLGCIGAFLGGDACVCILCGASVLGFVFGVIRLLFVRKRECLSIPFGPFLSFCAFIWMFFR